MRRCGYHGLVAGAPDFQGHLKRVEELRTVRQQLGGLLSPIGDENLCSRVVLAANELIASGVVHTGGCTVAVWLSHWPRIRVEVADLSDELPLLHTDEGLLRLRILDQVTSRWGVEPRLWGKAVWFEIAIPPPVNGWHDN
jgi:hypothetical protein